MKKVLGIMGSIAVGKSTITKTLQALGAHIIRVDDVVRAVRERPEVDREICRVLGDRIATNGKVDLNKLRIIAFAEKKAMDDLKEIMRGDVEREIMREIAEHRYDKVCVIENFDFEPGSTLELLCDEIWLITCDGQVQKQRVMARNGWTEAYAEARIAASGQSPGAFELVDAIIDTTEDGTATQAVVDFWKETDWEYSLTVA